MRKIPTLFVRDSEDRRYVTEQVTPGCEWVLAEEGIATRKHDGTCVSLDVDGAWWARREVKPGRQRPLGFVGIEYDEVTGKTVGWEPIAHSPFVKFFAEALEPLTGFGQLTGSKLEPGTFELIGPKINGNPEQAAHHRLIRHDNAEQIAGLLLSYLGLAQCLRILAADRWEGLVWHHPDGRMAKLKAKDFPREPAE